LETVRNLRGGTEAAQPGQLAAVAAAVALRAGLTWQIEIPTLDGRVVLPTLGCTDPAGPGRLARFSTHRGDTVLDVGDRRVRPPSPPGWPAVRPGQGAPGGGVIIGHLHPSRTGAETTPGRRAGPRTGHRA